MEHFTYYSGCIADVQQHNKLRWDMFDLICLLVEREHVVVRNGNEKYVDTQPVLRLLKV
jgi:hypothetical protein